MDDILLLSLGALLGVNFRFILYRKIAKLNVNKNLIILVINTFSTFLIGLFFSVVPRIESLVFSHQLTLLFSIGFLGSLSTFSSFVYDLFELVIQLKFLKAIKLFVISLALGMIALTIGAFLGNQ